jgi:hypothetical protein
MNRSNTTSYDRRTLVEQREDRETVGSHEDGTPASQEHSPRGVRRMTLLSVVGRASAVQDGVSGCSSEPDRPWA